MKIIFKKWWNNGNKVFLIINYKKSWKEYSNPPMIEFKTNGAKKKYDDSCLSVTLTIGYIVFNYTNFDLQGECKKCV